MTTPAKPKRRSSGKRKTKTQIPAPADSFFAEALSVRGRFTLSWMLFRAGLRILIKGRAIV